MATVCCLAKSVALDGKSHVHCSVFLSFLLDPDCHDVWVSSPLLGQILKEKTQEKEMFTLGYSFRGLILWLLLPSAVGLWLGRVSHKRKNA